MPFNCKDANLDHPNPHKQQGMNKLTLCKSIACVQLQVVREIPEAYWQASVAVSVTFYYCDKTSSPRQFKEGRVDVRPTVPGAVSTVMWPGVL